MDGPLLQANTSQYRPKLYLNSECYFFTYYVIRRPTVASRNPSPKNQPQHDVTFFFLVSSLTSRMWPFCPASHHAVPSGVIFMAMSSCGKSPPSSSSRLGKALARPLVVEADFSAMSRRRAGFVRLIGYVGFYEKKLKRLGLGTLCGKDYAEAETPRIGSTTVRQGLCRTTAVCQIGYVGFYEAGGA